MDLVGVYSTNSEVPGFTTLERDISPVLDRVFAGSDQRIIVAAPSASACASGPAGDGRRGAAPPQGLVHVCWSMVRNMGVARDLGFRQRLPRPTC